MRTFRIAPNGSCTNRLRIPVSEMNEAVLQAIEEHALTPDAIEQVITLSERDDVRDLQATLAKEHKDITKRIARLVAAIEGGADSISLVAKLNELEARQKAIPVERASLRPIPRLAPQVRDDRLGEWRRNLRGSTTQARAVIQRIVVGRITFTPTFEGYTFEAPTRFDGLFCGIVVPRSAWQRTPGQGTEHIRPEDVYYGAEVDVDYGRLLDEAMSGKGVRARQDSNL